MNNFINVRVQAHNHNKTLNSIKHNLRVIKSLNEDELSKNSNYIMLDNKITKITKENKNDICKQLLTQYKEERKIHNEIYKQHNKRNLRDVKSTWCEGVFTFSEQMKEDIKNKKYNFNDLVNVANECLKEISSKYDTQINYMVLHLDETCPHLHWSISNFDEKGMSLFHTNKNKDFLSQLQDIGYKHFSKLGMERGVSKEISGVNHKSVNKYWRDKNIQEKQINNKLKNVNLSLKDTNSKIENIINDKQNLVNTLDTQLNELQLFKINLDIDLDNTKKLRDDVKNDTNKSIEEKKRNYEDITKQQKQIRTLREVYTKKEKSIRDLKNEIIEDMKDILEKSKKLFGYDEEKLQQNILNKLSKYSSYKIKVKELETTNNEMKKIKEDNIKLVEHITKLEKKLDDAYELDKDKSKLIKDYMNREKEEKRFTNSEVANVTQKYENEVKELKSTIKQQKQKIDEISSINKDYEDFIVDNNLSEDFKDRHTKKHNRHRH